MNTVQPTVVPNSGNSPVIPQPVVSAAFAAPSYGAELTNGNFYTKLTTSDYQLSNIDGTNYTLTRLSDGKLLVTDTLANVSNYASANEGFTVAIGGGADAAGNKYLIQPTSNAASNISVNSIVAADPRTIAAALSFRTSSSSGNTGAGVISGGTSAPGFSAGLLPTAGINLSFVTGVPSQLNLTDIVAGQVITYKVPGGSEQSVTVATPVLPATTTSTLINYTQGMTISVSGMSFVMTGTPNNGDTFKLERNAAATTDGRNSLALGKLQTQNTVAGGTATFQTAFAELVANVGIKTRELRVTGAAQESALNQAQSARDAFSGVNLDEEAANMIRYQQAYQAAAKVLDIGSKLFDSLLQLG
jgi:flagellar hook-associated protein 1 FlgK